MSPNDKYVSLVAAAGYLPLVLRGEDYLELLPVAWRAINDYGIRIGHRTYDAPQLGPWRRQHSGHSAKRGLWEVHYDPYDLSREGTVWHSERTDDLMKEAVAKMRRAADENDSGLPHRQPENARSADTLRNRQPRLIPSSSS